MSISAKLGTGVSLCNEQSGIEGVGQTDSEGGPKGEQQESAPQQAAVPRARRTPRVDKEPSSSLPRAKLARPAADEHVDVHLARERLERRT